MYYVYILKNPKTNLPFYVGKGKGKRASYHISENKKGRWTENRHKDNVIRQLISEGLEPIIEYIFWHEDEKVAYEYEEKIIIQYGRKEFDPGGILTNICKDSCPPHNTYTEERKQKYRTMMLGNKLAAGRIMSEEEKIARARSNQLAWDSGRRVVTDKMRQASKSTHSGKIVSEETRFKQSEAAKRNKAWTKGKTNEEIFGEEKAAEIRRKKSELPPPNRKPVTIDNITYESIRAASLALHISEYKVTKRVSK